MMNHTSGKQQTSPLADVCDAVNASACRREDAGKCKFSAYSGLAAHVVRTWHRVTPDCGGGGGTRRPLRASSDPNGVTEGGHRTWIFLRVARARDHEDGPAYGTRGDPVDGRRW